MRSPTPAVRAALFGLVVVMLVAVAGAGLHLAAVERDAEAAAGTALLARASTVAAALDAAPGRARRDALAPFQAPGADGRLVLLDDRGGVLAATDDALARSVDWRRVLSAGSGSVRTVRGRGGNLVVALHAAPRTGGAVVAAVQPRAAAAGSAVVEALVAALALGGLLAASLAGMAWYAGPRASKDLALLGERLAHGGGDPAALVRHGARSLGPLAEALTPLSDRLAAQDREVSGAHAHVAALYQTNPHYVVLCSLGGTIVEANPAFYAATGLPPDVVRGGPFDALRETFPIEPLLEAARRSLREGSAISGVEYAIVDRDDETRPVEVSLRAFSLDGDDVVVIQATDLARQKTLERRVAAFSDTLDLMVDQRVQQLTAGQQALRTVLDAAGIAIASFDGGGATSRWNGGARALTGRSIAEVPHFAAVTSVFGLDAAERTAFAQWFWSPSAEPFVARHAVGEGAEARTRQVVWQRVHADVSGRSDLRTLVGVEVPASLAVAPERAGGAGRSPAVAAPEAAA
ncbi:PAS domain-containing protein [Rubrivirga sp. S365]|uniref:PAS domain-containing protein n=1 Tax=Rubrivirga sp. S365 TaxID=3076080 RepID=UPI0028C9BBF8|nr:PAS domain-containing protein [Rubrivirga sp. S365]MDT7857537.1 PAS domain-containing protein [Rubrivirga sp. S365]